MIYSTFASDLVMNNSSIIYVNFAQYDNTGRILDYLLENFHIVAHFSFDHLRLKNGRKTNFVRVYVDGKCIHQRKLLSIRTPGPFLFPSLPIVAVLMLLQTIIYSFRLNLRYGKFEYYFTVNAFSAWIGILAQKLFLIRKTVFWVWDYYPLLYPDWRIRLARRIYWWLDKSCMKLSNKIIFTNIKLLKLRQETGHLGPKKKVKIVPIGTEILPIEFKKDERVILGFLGMLKENQGIDLIFDSIDLLIKQNPHIKIEIIGSGPEEIRFKKRGEKYAKHISFLGFIEDQDKIIQIIKKWSIGLATYKPVEKNESYWGDPSKIKKYIGAGVPVITTDVSYFSEIIKKHKAGVLIAYTPESLAGGIQTILKNELMYKKSAFKLAKKYNYKTLYPKMFI